jgi:hypothetical protein
VSCHVHPTERRSAEIIAFPPRVEHWPSDGVLRSELAPLPSCSGLILWRPERSASFWVETDDAGRIVEVWAMRYAAYDHQLREDAKSWRVFVYHEPQLPEAQAEPEQEAAPPPAPAPKKRRRARGAA